MPKHRTVFRRPMFSFVLAISFIFVFAPNAFAQANLHASLLGPKQRYLALGDSLAYGYQPDLDFSDGYADDFYSNLKLHGTSSFANMGCPAETSSTFINGGCTFSLIRKYIYFSDQLDAAVDYLHYYAGQVSPVTLDIGANDILPDINKSTCAISPNFQTHLQTVDNNLKKVILPALKSALTVNGRVTGDLLIMNYYDPYQNRCPNTIPYIQMVNQHLAADVNGYGNIVDVFSAFGGAASPNPNTCNYTWICSIFSDIHATDKGYSVIANAFEARAGY